MYGLPRDVDLTFFAGKYIMQVCIGANDLILHFDDSALSVLIMSKIACKGPGAVLREYETYRDAAKVVVSFLEEIVELARGDEKGTLVLEFKNGGRIEVYDDSKEYESYVITYRDIRIVV